MQVDSRLYSKGMNVNNNLSPGVQYVLRVIFEFALKCMVINITLYVQVSQ